MLRHIFNLQNPWRRENDGLFTFPMYSRDIESILIENLQSEKIIGLIGSRQVGKSSLLYRLIQYLLKDGVSDVDIFYFNLDDINLHQIFSNIVSFTEFIGKSNKRKYIFIDEIQRLNNPGLFLKEVYDLQLPYKIIYSGASQLELKAKLKESLVGRSRFFTIHALSFNEMKNFCAPVTNDEILSHALIYGSYPGVCIQKSEMEKKLTIKDIFQSYIEKDIVNFLQINNIDAFNKLLILLASQSGAMLNIDNLSKTIRIKRDTIEHYLNMLEGTFIIKRLYPFFKNYKKEITKTPKLYILDNGIRNFSLNNFNSIDLRQDVGELFETFIFTEMLKKDYYSMNKLNYWRTTNQVEIDFIVKDDNGLSAFEIKWQKKVSPKSFKSFMTYYPEAICKLINKDNFTDVLQI